MADSAGKTYSFYGDADSQEVIVNPYDASGVSIINEVATPSPTRAISELDTPQRIALAKDAYAKKRMAELNMTEEEYIESLQTQLPPGITMKEVVNQVPYSDIEKYSTTIKNGIAKFNDGAGGLVKEKPSFFTTSLKWAGKIGGWADGFGVKDKLSKLTGLDKLGKIGLNPLDGLTEGSFAMAAIELALKETSKIKVNGFLSKTKLIKHLQEFIVTEVFFLCARWGSYVACVDIVKGYSTIITAKDRRKAIPLILENFRLKDEDVSLGWQPAAENVFRQLDFISPDWNRLPYGTGIAVNLEPWVNANKGALDLLRFAAHIKLRNNPDGWDNDPALTADERPQLQECTAAALIQADLQFGKAIKNKPPLEVVEMSSPVYKDVTKVEEAIANGTSQGSAQRVDGTPMERQLGPSDNMDDLEARMAAEILINERNAALSGGQGIA